METKQEQIARMKANLADIKERKASRPVKRDATGFHIDRNGVRYCFPDGLLDIFCDYNPDTGRYTAR